MSACGLLHLMLSAVDANHSKSVEPMTVSNVLSTCVHIAGTYISKEHCPHFLSCGMFLHPPLALSKHLYPISGWTTQLLQWLSNCVTSPRGLPGDRRLEFLPTQMILRSHRHVHCSLRQIPRLKGKTVCTIATPVPSDTLPDLWWTKKTSSTAKSMHGILIF